MNRPDRRPDHPLRRWAGRLLRLAVAAAGLTLVANQLTWRDAVALPAGYALDPEHLFDQPTELPVVTMTGTTVRLALPDGQLADLPADRLGTDPTGPRFKPGLLGTIGRCRPALLALAALLSLGIYPLQTLRWWLLLRARRIPAGLGDAFRIFMAGLFYNSFMPGMTGGDLFKAYYVARHSPRRAEAVMTILVDRAAGLVGLVLLACGAAAMAMLAGHADPVTRSAAQAVALVAAALVVAAAVYFLPPVQRLLGLDLVGRLLPRDGLVAAVRQAVSAYRRHRRALAGAVGLSVSCHAIIIAVALLSARAVGMQTAAGKFVTLMPLVVIAGSLPLSFMGVGLMEPTGVALLAEPAVASANQVVTMLVLVRLYQVAWSTLGALFIVRGGLTLPADSGGKPTQPTCPAQATDPAGLDDN